VTQTVDIERALEENEALRRENKILREELQALKKGLFGRKTERLQPGQLTYVEEGDAPAPCTHAPAKSGRQKPKAAKGHGRAPFPDDAPRDTQVLDVEEADRVCPTCKEEMRLIGMDVTERGDLLPVRFVVRRYERAKYACPNGHAVVTAKAPEGVVKGAKYEPSVYAFLGTAKYCDHLPLHRLSGILKRQGLHLPKQQMWDMIVTLDEQVAQPILEQMRSELLAEPVLHSDETPLTLKVEDGRGSATGWAWGWRNLRESEDSKVLIEFLPSRARDGPLDFLGDWSGTLICDGYSGQNEVVRRNGIVRAGCWSHARRKLVEAFDLGASQAAELLAPIQRLFRLERAVNRRADRLELELDARIELRRRVRAARSARIIATIFERATMLEGNRAVLPKSKLGKAISYLLNQRAALSVACDDPRIPIHNNDAERDLRHLKIGQNNWMIFGSKRGGEVGCRLYSLVLSAKEAGIDVQEYLEDALVRVNTTPASQIATLTPWGWARARAAQAGQG
jgi:transposase